MDVKVQNELAFLADRYDGLEIYNVTNPKNIVRVGNYNRSAVS